MPTYEYKARDPRAGCDKCRGGFEVQQDMAAAPLEACPNCGAPIKRIIGAVGISTHRPSPRMLSDKNLAEKGFHKLVNEGDGRFRKVV